MIDVVVELIAHRAGNSIDSIAAAASAADTIEVDVHIRRRRLEVRHAKVFWPTPIEWERWWVDLHPSRPPSLREILDGIPDGTGVWLDLKGFTPRLTNGVLRELQTHPTRSLVTLSSRSWWALRPARAAGFRTMRSVGARWQIWSVMRVRRWGSADGVVINERYLTERRVRNLLGLGPPLYTWGITDAGRGRHLIDIGVTGLILDDLALIRQLREPAGSG